jgi:hypothetical protein
LAEEESKKHRIETDLAEERLGKVMLEPSGPVVAGSMGQWKLIYTAGSYGVDEGGTLMLVQRTACDWQNPQFDQPREAGYTTVATNARARLNMRFEKKQAERPWQKWCLVIDVTDGYISPGETVTIVLGNQSKGSPGIRAQSFVESAHEFRVLLDPTNAALLRRLPASPFFPIVAGDLDHLVCVIPSQAKIGTRVEVFVKGEDSWGNPIVPVDGCALKVSGDADGVIRDGTVEGRAAGTLTVKASKGDLFCESNPMTVYQNVLDFSRYWGDLHAQTESTVGTGSEEEYFSFGRNIARLDFISHQGNDFQVTDQDWERLNRVIKQFNEPGKYVVFPGYEWSGNTSAGGDHNVIYKKDDQPIYRSSHWQLPEVAENDRTPAHPITELHQRLHENGNAIVIPHVGGRYADVRKYFDNALTPLVEIVSCWGVFEWMLWDALEQGHIAGVVCNSDGHKGRPGAEGPGAGQFGIYGGLTCVLAEELTRDAIFGALEKRRCYGTTGVRMGLWFEANGHPMGSVVQTMKPVELTAKVKGTGPLDSLLLYQGKNIVEQIRPEAFDNVPASRRIRVSWEGARIRGRARRATWDGSISVEGAQIRSAKTFSFDSPADGITHSDEKRIYFKSSTTGDVDGIELLLDSNQQGILSFDSLIGHCKVDLKMLDRQPHRVNFGGLELTVIIQKYPEKIETRQLELTRTVLPDADTTSAYLIKAIQEDGHMAWSSPIFVRAAHPA